jgi:hypothetical protein
VHHHHYHAPPPPDEDLRLEAVTVSVGFDDLLDETLTINHPQLDTMIVVTSHADRRTQGVARKHGAICVQTDLFSKHGRAFNKGAAINAGFGHFQYYGWRMHLDADIALPDNFRRVLFNHTPLVKSDLYGADRVNVIGRHELEDLKHCTTPQHTHQCIVESQVARAHGGRFVDTLHGYLPLGYFQLWHARTQKSYPYSLGTAEHDDCLFAMLWPEAHRHLLQSIIVYHICEREPVWGENWDGVRQQPRLSK